MNKIKLALIFCGLTTAQMTAQESKYELFIGLNQNLYLPANSEKKTYHIFWIDDGAPLKVRMGGYGIGASVYKPLKGNFKLKAELNISRQRYWEEPLDFKNDQNIPQGYQNYFKTDHLTGLNVMGHYFLGKKFSLGTGLGAQFLLASRTTINFSSLLSDGKTETFSDRTYKTFTPTIPIELSLKGKKILVNLRYEYGFLNRYKKDLTKYKSEHFSALYFEVAYKIK